MEREVQGNAEPSRRSRAWQVVVALAAVGALAALITIWPGEGRPAPAPAVGFNDNAVTRGVASPEQTAELIARSGARIDRVQIDWATLEPSPGEYRFGLYDQIYAADLARGVQPLFIFAFAPGWAAGDVCAAATGTCHAPPDPAHYDDAAATAAAIADRYPRLAGIEIWNEPNTPYFWFPRADPAAYTALLRACYAAIKAVAPSLPVAGGSTSSSTTLGAGHMPAADFVRDIYANGADDAMDALSVHLYPEPGDTIARSAVDSLMAIRDAEVRSGGSQPIWTTETGASTSGPRAVSESSQATTLLSLYQHLGAFDYVQMILFHTLVPSPAAPSDPENGFGVVTPELTPRPAYCVLAQAWSGSASC